MKTEIHGLHPGRSRRAPQLTATFTKFTSSRTNAESVPMIVRVDQDDNQEISIRADPSGRFGRSPTSRPSRRIGQQSLSQQLSQFRTPRVLIDAGSIGTRLIELSSVFL